MSTEIREELATFEKELATLVARFLRLYERLESEVRPERHARPPQPATLPTQRAPESAQALLPGYQ